MIAGNLAESSVALDQDVKIHDRLASAAAIVMFAVAASIRPEACPFEMLVPLLEPEDLGAEGGVRP